MTAKNNGIGRVLGQSLRLSSDETHEREKAEEAERADYRRTYWQGYAKKVKRIFGTVTPAEYEAVKQRADEAGRSVWGQVWAEAQAYRQGVVLASGKVAEQQRELVIELRRVGNNLNQLARLGHIDQRKQGDLARPNANITSQAHAQLAKLEAVVTKFDDGVTVTVRPNEPHDH